MANKIQLLPEVVANQIAAGEVVNRPSSVVKEMMENAIDAGATCIIVNSREGGRELIQVVDNGCGMSPIDARMAFDRHATSKIRQADDIYSLHTFGFRGEALASIAAVAQVELRTRQAEDELGTLSEINGGEFISQKPVSCPVGSQFIVRNLFYNVPARRRFMEKPNVAAGHIKAEFQRVALCNPEVRFELYNNDAPIYHLASSSLVGRIVDVVGPAIKNNLLEVVADTSIVKIRGYVGRPAAAKKSKPDQYLFVNGRYFRSPYFMKALLRAYDRLIPEGTFPACFLYFEIDPQRVDVNVHPQKTEVKFADEEAIWQILNAAVRETLGKTGAVPMMDFEEEGRVEIPVVDKGVVYNEPPSQSNWNYNPFLEEDEPASSTLHEPQGAFRSSRSGGEPSFSPLHYNKNFSAEFDEIASADAFDFVPSEEEAMAQELPIEGPARGFEQPILLSGGAVVARYGGRLVVVDLRRAREAVLFEEYMHLLKNGSAVSQQLLFPEELVLSEGEYALLEEHLEQFEAVGFDLRLCGGGALEVRGIPADTTPGDFDTLLYELLKLVQEPTTTLEEHRRRLAAAMARSGARHAALPRGEEEAGHLLERLAELKGISYTPSGQQVMAEWSSEELLSKLR
uniref:DNA mismatch repair endonuclease MutL n=1 Tax=Alistipes sp. TaxID=1872444 RepID=UPI00405758C4